MSNFIFEINGKFIEFKDCNEFNTELHTSYFTQESAKQRFGCPDKDGWRLPTAAELEAVCKDSHITVEVCEAGDVSFMYYAKQPFMESCGFMDTSGNIYLEKTGFYWASDIYGEQKGLGRCLRFRKNFCKIDTVGASSRMSVRLCREIAENSLECILVDNTKQEDTVKLEQKTIPPDGYEIDRENSTLDLIKFRKIEKRWRDNREAIINGFFLGCSSVESLSDDVVFKNTENCYNVFTTKEQAKSALAMARISQIMANDKRFGGPITDEEWNNTNFTKQAIIRHCGAIAFEQTRGCFCFLTFHTIEQRALFLKENEDLVRDYLMLD